MVIVLLDCVPDEGTKVSIKDEYKGELRVLILIGRFCQCGWEMEPVTEELRSALLGLNSD